MRTIGEEFTASNHLTAKQIDVLEELRDGESVAIPSRTLAPLLNRGLIELVGEKFTITGHGLNVLMANS